MATQAFQAYDFLHLFRTHGCRIQACLLLHARARAAAATHDAPCPAQIGGEDQWGNITAGCDLIRRSTGAAAFGITVPLLLTASGEKIGKTAGNAVWLDGARTSPFELYQFCVSQARLQPPRQRATRCATDWRCSLRPLLQPDAAAGRLLGALTLLPLPLIRTVEEHHAQRPELRLSQRVLGCHLVRLVHGADGLERAVDATGAVFGAQEPGDAIHAIAALRGQADCVELAEAERASLKLADVAAMTALCGSRSEARRLMRGGGLYVNGARATADEVLSAQHVVEDTQGRRWTLLQKGKHAYAVIAWT